MDCSASMSLEMLDKHAAIVSAIALLFCCR